MENAINKSESPFAESSIGARMPHELDDVDVVIGCVL